MLIQFDCRCIKFICFSVCRFVEASLVVTNLNKSVDFALRKFISFLGFIRLNQILLFWSIFTLQTMYRYDGT